MEEEVVGEDEVVRNLGRTIPLRSIIIIIIIIAITQES